MNTYLQALKKYSTFSGRANRTEYWVFALYNITFGSIIIILDNILGIALPNLGYGPIYCLYALATLLPGLGVFVRRLHDVDKSGWMIFISLIPIIGTIWIIVLLATKSNPEKNQYGEVSNYTQNNESTTDELILLTFIWSVLITAFWAILTRVNVQFYDTLTFKMANKIIPIIGGFLTFSLAFVVSKPSKRFFLIILGGLTLLYSFYTVFEEFMK